MGGNLLLALFHHHHRLPESVLVGYAKSITDLLRDAGHYGLQNHLVWALHLYARVSPSCASALERLETTFARLEPEAASTPDVPDESEQRWSPRKMLNALNGSDEEPSVVSVMPLVLRELGSPVEVSSSSWVDFNLHSGDFSYECGPFDRCDIIFDEDLVGTELEMEAQASGDPRCWLHLYISADKMQERPGAREGRISMLFSVHDITQLAERVFPSMKLMHRPREKSGLDPLAPCPLPATTFRPPCSSDVARSNPVTADVPEELKPHLKHRQPAARARKVSTTSIALLASAHAIGNPGTPGANAQAHAPGHLPRLGAATPSKQAPTPPPLLRDFQVGGTDATRKASTSPVIRAGIQAQQPSMEPSARIPSLMASGQPRADVSIARKSSMSSTSLAAGPRRSAAAPKPSDVEGTVSQGSDISEPAGHSLLELPGHVPREPKPAAPASVTPAKVAAVEAIEAGSDSRALEQSEEPMAQESVELGSGYGNGSPVAAAAPEEFGMHEDESMGHDESMELGIGYGSGNPVATSVEDMAASVDQGGNPVAAETGPGNESASESQSQGMQGFDADHDEETLPPDAAAVAAIDEVHSFLAVTPCDGSQADEGDGRASLGARLVEEAPFFKVDRLRQELKNRGLDTKGKKAELLKRLQDACSHEQVCNAPAMTDCVQGADGQSANASEVQCGQARLASEKCEAQLDHDDTMDLEDDLAESAIQVSESQGEQRDAGEVESTQAAAARDACERAAAEKAAKPTATRAKKEAAVRAKEEAARAKQEAAARAKQEAATRAKKEAEAEAARATEEEEEARAKEEEEAQAREALAVAEREAKERAAAEKAAKAAATRAKKEAAARAKEEAARAKKEAAAQAKQEAAARAKKEAEAARAQEEEEVRAREEEEAQATAEREAKERAAAEQATKAAATRAKKEAAARAKEEHAKQEVAARAKKARGATSAAVAPEQRTCLGKENAGACTTLKPSPPKRVSGLQPSRQAHVGVDPFDFPDDSMLLQPGAEVPNRRRRPTLSASPSSSTPRSPIHQVTASGDLSNRGASEAAISQRRALHTQADSDAFDEALKDTASHRNAPAYDMFDFDEAPTSPSNPAPRVRSKKRVRFELPPEHEERVKAKETSEAARPPPLPAATHGPPPKSPSKSASKPRAPARMSRSLSLAPMEEPASGCEVDSGLPLRSDDGDSTSVADAMATLLSAATNTVDEHDELSNSDLAEQGDATDCSALSDAAESLESTSFPATDAAPLATVAPAAPNDGRTISVGVAARPRNGLNEGSKNTNHKSKPAVEVEPSSTTPTSTTANAGKRRPENASARSLAAAKRPPRGSKSSSSVVVTASQEIRAELAAVEAHTLDVTTVQTLAQLERGPSPTQAGHLSPGREGEGVDDLDHAESVPRPKRLRFATPSVEKSLARSSGVAAPSSRSASRGSANTAGGEDCADADASPSSSHIATLLRGLPKRLELAEERDLQHADAVKAAVSLAFSDHSDHRIHRACDVVAAGKASVGKKSVDALTALSNITEARPQKRAEISAVYRQLRARADDVEKCLQRVAAGNPALRKAAVTMPSEIRAKESDISNALKRKLGEVECMARERCAAIDVQTAKRVKAWTRESASILAARMGHLIAAS